MKTYYVSDDNGKYVSTDHSHRYTKIEGGEIIDLITSKEWKGKRFMKASDENDRNQVYIEVPHSKAKMIRAGERRSQYVQDIKAKYPYQLASLDSITGNNGESELTGEEAIADLDVDVVAEVMHNIDLETLRKAVGSLSEKEMTLITALYLSNTPMNESEYSKQSGIPRMTIHDRKNVILKKLRKIL